MFDEEQLEAASRVMRALAHPLRLGILQSLAKSEKTVSELHEELGCSQPTMSQQLRILEMHGLVKMRKEGTTKRCSVRNPDFLKLFSCLENHLQQYFRF